MTFVFFIKVCARMCVCASVHLVITDKNPISDDATSIDMFAEEGSVDTNTSTSALKYAQ